MILSLNGIPNGQFLGAVSIRDPRAHETPMKVFQAVLGGMPASRAFAHRVQSVMRLLHGLGMLIP
jgi:hypothetical protein